jgi:uncharacterized protein YbcV (DUF1398 family)
MFTVDQIELAHSNVKSGADFPKYIREIKELGVRAFETWVSDSRTDYYGADDFQTVSKPKYDVLQISDVCSQEKFIQYLKMHQRGETDYLTFCKHCAETGVEKWFVDLDEYACRYFDISGNEVLVEVVPRK